MITEGQHAALKYGDRITNVNSGFTYVVSDNDNGVVNACAVVNMSNFGDWKLEPGENLTTIATYAVKRISNGWVVTLGGKDTFIDNKEALFKMLAAQLEDVWTVPGPGYKPVDLFQLSVITQQPEESGEVA